MSDNTTTVSIDTKEEFIAQVKETGVVVDDGDALAHTEGEGRATRYFVGDVKVKKADIEHVYEMESDDDGSIEAVIPVEGDEPEHGVIACEVCGRAVGYLTGSHMGTHEDGQPTTVAQYREAVADDKGIDPEDVPLAPDELNDVFRQAGEHDEETLEELSAANKARWEAGEYDHLRKEDDDEVDAEGNGAPAAEA